MTWYDDHIEPPIQPIVRLLRNCGINTTNSCGHEMSVEGDLAVDGQLKDIHEALWHHERGNGKEPEYRVTVDLNVYRGVIAWTQFTLHVGPERAKCDTCGLHSIVRSLGRCVKCGE